MSMKKILCLGIILVLATSFFGAMRVSGDNVYVLAGDVYLAGGAPGTAVDENSYAMATYIYTAGVGPDAQPNADQIEADIANADLGNPANYLMDVGSLWDWEPCVAGTQDVMVVLETVWGMNGWTSANYTTSSNTTLSCGFFDQLPDVEIRGIPTPIFNGMGLDWVNITWNAIIEDAVIGPNVVNYDVQRATAIDGPYASIGTSTDQVLAAGSVFYNDTGLAAGMYYYRIAVNYARGLAGYTTMGLSDYYMANVGDVTSPTIQTTVPVDGAIGVALNQDVVITFSEPIDTATFAWTCVPDPGGWVWVWTVGDTVATGSHANFALSTAYTFTVTAADDTAGNPLVAGPVPNPWSWTTTNDATSPTIQTTVPADGVIGVPINQDVIITFSEAIDTATFAYTIVPDPGGWTWVWSVGDTVATGSHTDFVASTAYTFTVTTADDLAGNPLAAGPVPNPWGWTTTTDVTSPTITVTNPADGATGVALNQDVVITFSEAINTATFAYTIVPDPGGWTWVWSVGDTIATGSHTDFAAATTYTFTVTAADDLGGNPLAAGAVPNPWDWTTVSDVTSPTISATTPVNNTMEVAVDQDIVITFDEAIDTATFTYTCVPDPLGWVWVWSVGDTVATGTHTDFATDTQYTFTVTAADDVAGNPLAAGTVVNPFYFTTVDTIAPVITGVGTSPSTPDTNSDVTINATVTDADTVTVTVVITDPDGNAVTTPGNVTMSAGTGANEFEYVVDNLDLDVAGTYSFTIWANDSSGNYNSITDTFDVDAVAPPTVLVSVTVKDSGGVLIGDADVVIKYTGNGTVVASGKTAVLFGVWMTDLGAGDYTVTASKSGYTTASETFQLSGNEYSHTVTITLEGGDLLWLWIIIIIIVILIVILLLWFMTRKKPAEEPKPEEEAEVEEMKPTEGEVEGEAAAAGAAAPAAAATTKTCVSCGREIKVEYDLCPFCGAHQTETAGGAEEAAEEPKAEEPAEEPKAEEAAEESKGEEEKKMNCKNCGKEILPGFAICPYCGTSQ